MSINYGEIPGNWSIGRDGSKLDPEIVYTPGKPSIKFSAGNYGVNNITENNNLWLPQSGPLLKEGDKIRMAGVMQSDPSQFGPGTTFGFDLYSGSGRLKEYSTPWLPWGSGWRERALEVIVPGPFTETDSGIKLDPPQQAIGFIPFICGNWRYDPATANANLPIPANHWFTDLEIYINPGSEPTPPAPTEWIITATTEPPTEEWKITVKPYRVGGWL